MQGIRSVEGYHSKWGSRETIPLSVRETQVLQLVAEGKGNKDIGDSLGISLRTVKVHMTNIFDKLGVNRRMDAVRMLSSESYWPETRAS